MTLIESPKNPALYASLTDTPDGVSVEFRRRAGYRGPSDPGVTRRLAAATFDAPFHLVADHVVDILKDFAL
jgi:hypothetical protein